MKKIVEDLQKKSKKEIEQEIVKTIDEITRLVVEGKVNPTKDTNTVHKKRKYLAQLRTVASSVESV